ncbi:isochorismatase family protein [Streptomyces sp. HNM0574]|uniref:isochorismatase family protein n=1 Tax=Streptomyces sp. HNM0574 TaxID=2714954 RepID=UPI00146A7C7B|nr:isochorismatase family protein [Streptomyces sp. HNM0574]NLU70350.1 isochorismatase family protein [Streptomyces sp. HNM0574]
MSGETPPRSDDHLLTPDNAALVLIDYQPEQVGTVASIGHEELMLNVTAVARAAAAYGLPVVLTTVGVELGANSGTIEELRGALPETEEIDRTTLNSWEDPDFRAAVEATGRRKILMTGLWTEVCVAFPTLDMLREGYEIYPVADAIGGISPAAHDSAMQRMVHAGARPVTAISLTAELQRDWGRPDADRLRTIMRWYFPRLNDLPARA